MVTTDIGDPPPQDIDAERSVLGAVLLASHVLPAVRTVLDPEDFYRPAHALVYAAACKLADSGRPVDPITVAAELTDTGQARRMGGVVYLHTLVAAVPTAVNVGYYADIVAEKSLRRKFIAVSDRIRQAATAESPAGDVDGKETLLGHVAAQLIETEMLLDAKAATEPLDGLSTVAEFVAQYRNRPRVWVIPDLISQRDVVMTLAPPGAGKTTLSRQVCLCLAAGVHPFRPERRIPAKRTLLIDLEVDPDTAAEETDPLLGAVRRMGELDDDMARVWSHIEGLNLRRPADAALLERAVKESRPQFVAIGSLYKTGIQPRGGEGYEAAAMEVRDVLDRLRKRWGFALWIEHHMPKAAEGGRKANPFGSSVWEWWPSHGRILQREGDSPKSQVFSFSAPFRGDRGRRDYPAGFTRGGRLPWTPIWDETELDVLAGASS
jgi:hypothetical protein